MTVTLTTIDRAALTLTSLPSDPAQLHELWSTLSSADKDALFAHDNYVGNRDGLPSSIVIITTESSSTTSCLAPRRAIRPCRIGSWTYRLFGTLSGEIPTGC